MFYLSLNGNFIPISLHTSRIDETNSIISDSCKSPIFPILKQAALVSFPG